MPSYKNYDDLYTFLESAVPGASRGVGDVKDDVLNKDFAFNPNLVRTNSVKSGSAFDNSSKHTTKLTRGFIRNLITDQGEGRTKFPNMRCRFQFNPQDIEHIIEARRDMYLPILQDPKQLTQPMAGNASFAFELIFDRTTEVNSQSSRTASENGAAVPDQTSPATVGVFHDLRVLYSIIGQGLSSELIKAQEEKTKADIAYYASKNYSELNIQVSSVDGTSVYNGVGTTDEDGETVIDANSAELAEFLSNMNNPDSDAGKSLSFMSNINVGNSAFLIPQPCRVIFSPMFMVDGFVMNTRVLFTKFSAKMIPIQCKVFVQMQAVYIGFAKNKTFISQQLADTASANTAGQRTADSEALEISKILAKYLTTINIGYSSDTRIINNATDATVASSTSWNDQKEGNNKAYSGLAYQPIWLYGTKNFWYRRPFITADSSIQKQYNPWDSSYRLQFPNSINTPNFMPGLTMSLVSSKAEKEAIAEQIFETYKASTPSLKINIGSKIYGPFSTSEAADTFKTTKLGTVSGAYPTSDDYPSGVKLLGNYFLGIDIASKDVWNKYADKPHDLILAAHSPDDDYFNNANQSANAITPATPNSSNVSVFSSVVSSITTAVSSLTGTTTQKANDVQQLSLTYRSPLTSLQENTTPKWDLSIDGTANNGYATNIPTGIYEAIPDSLLQRVNTVHGLNNKYFVVLTETSTEIKVLTVADAGNVPLQFVTTRVVDVLQGSTTQYVASARQVYPSAQGLTPSPIGTIL